MSKGQENTVQCNSAVFDIPSTYRLCNFKSNLCRSPSHIQGTDGALAANFRHTTIQDW